MIVIAPDLNLFIKKQPTNYIQLLYELCTIIYVVLVSIFSNALCYYHNTTIYQMHNIYLTVCLILCVNIPYCERAHVDFDLQLAVTSF